jgi:hypothetical protein
VPKLLILKGTISNQDAIIMIDSGASRNFLSIDFVQKNGIRIDTSCKDVIRLADGHNISGEGTARSLRFHVGPYTTRTDFSVTKLTQGYDMILGKPWLTRINPTINWQTNELKIRSRVGRIVLKGLGHAKDRQIHRLEVSRVGKICEKINTKSEVNAKKKVTQISHVNREYSRNETEKSTVKSTVRSTVKSTGKQVSTSQPGTAAGKVRRFSSETAQTSYVDAQEVPVASSREKRPKWVMSKQKGKDRRLEGILEISSTQLKKMAKKGTPIFLGILTPVKQEVEMAESEINPAIKTIKVSGKEEQTRLQ